MAPSEAQNTALMARRSAGSTDGSVVDMAHFFSIAMFGAAPIRNVIIPKSV
jgi:hypothetical protein